jgi:hypothetical protein
MYIAVNAPVGQGVVRSINCNTCRYQNTQLQHNNALELGITKTLNLKRMTNLLSLKEKLALVCKFKFMRIEFLTHPRLMVQSVLNRVNLSTQVNLIDDDRKELKKSKYVENLAFMNSFHDLHYEYTADRELQMLRSCYIFHALNTILRQNELILANDLKGNSS